MVVIMPKRSRDPNTLSNYQEYVTVHTIANFSIDFEQKILNGDIILHVRAVDKSSGHQIVLDTSYLEIQDVKVNGETSKWELHPRSEPDGSALEIDLGQGVKQKEIVELRVSGKGFVEAGFLSHRLERLMCSFRSN